MKRLLSVCLSLCIMVSVFVSFDITASAKTNLKKTTVSASNISNGIIVSWKKVSGAKSYKVYRKASGAKKYSVVKKTNNKTVKYLDKKVSAGKTYSYQVVADKGKETSKSKTKSITRLLAPQNVKVQSYVKNPDCTIDVDDILNSGSLDDFDDFDDFDDNIYGVKITWTKSKGANKYDIYRKVGNGKLSKIKTTGNTSYFVDENLYDVKTCYYRVVARKNNSTSAVSATRKITYVEPTDISAMALTKGMYINWSTISGCDGYKLYRSTNGKYGNYTLISKLAKNKSAYTDTKVEINKTYYYKIVAYKGSANSVAMLTKAQYKGVMTVNVNVGATDESIKKSFELAIKQTGGMIIFDQLKAILKITSLDESIATVSDDYVVTGVSAGQVKAKAQISMLGVNEEIGFIQINVK
ncbi:MAG: hypothetical protein MR360_06390 [Ruminococcus sp.]|nr:hypothetical protein [Ruminococcus sp.]MCI5598921.1 hypothetical protein [Ruminococcus sp.]